ncbi:MAG: class I SAM-dependent methyltransferase [Pseudomonadota bacterium]
MLASTAEDDLVAAALAEELCVPFIDALPTARKHSQGKLAVIVSEGIPHLQLVDAKAPGPVPVGFESAALRHRRRAGHNELLGRAVGWKQGRAPKVIDSTGGYGIDAFLLADFGCTVTLTERNPVLGVLLDHAITRARSAGDPWLRDVAERMHLLRGDANRIESEVVSDAQVIYLDPMFPVTRRAAPGKEMQVLQALLERDKHHTPDPDGEALFQWARQQGVPRIVVKRPRKAPLLGAKTPSHMLEGKSVRYDVYVR